MTMNHKITIESGLAIVGSVVTICCAIDDKPYIAGIGATLTAAAVIWHHLSTLRGRPVKQVVYEFAESRNDDWGIAVVESLAGQEIAGLIYSLDRQQAALYGEANKEILAGKVSLSVNPTFAINVAYAIDQWVVYCFNKLYEYSPRTVANRQEIIDRLNMAAYKNLHRGFVLRLESEQQRAALLSAANAIDRWVRQQFFDRSK